MRYLVQFLIPALIFVAVVWALVRSRGRGRGRDQTKPASDSDTAAFIIILLVSGAVALGTAYLLIGLLE